jgi:hypothetical protein
MSNAKTLTAGLGKHEGEAREFLDRLFSDEEDYREQAVADLTGI